MSLATGGGANQLPVITNIVNDALPIRITVTSAALIDSSTGQSWPLTTLV